jgi:hypothetical protein
MWPHALIFCYRAFGAVLPDIILLESKRFTAPFLHFEIGQYLFVTVLYMLAAGVVASVIPMRGGVTPWKAIVVGLTLPWLVSGVTAAADRVGRPTGQQLSLRGAQVGQELPAGIKIPGNVVDLMALF